MRAWWRDTMASSVRIAHSMARPTRISRPSSSSEPSTPCASRQRRRLTPGLSGNAGRMDKFGEPLAGAAVHGTAGRPWQCRTGMVQIPGGMCGIFGIYGHDEASNIAYLGLHALQHRGQESAGIVTADGSKLHRQVAMGLVSESFGKDTLEALPGRSAIGHVRYSTAGSSELRNAQPFLFEYAHGGLAIAHNGNLVNAAELRAELEA